MGAIVALAFDANGIIWVLARCESTFLELVDIGT
jgi:hypothetical protein